MKNIRIRITGKVFKTGYRFHVWQIADLFNINGFVQYNSVDSVYVEASGDKKNIDSFLAFIRLGNFTTVIDKFEALTSSVSHQKIFKIIENNINNN
ncbi:MAG: hypothetical protein HN704_03050 [Bacteroidetes bacterium]|jgi:acylphosphatase|nr:hypothetical protein [Bacteroidota bacterium]MBT7142623.1 hypothetical protein [Bacteroidota bacterium]MBT7490566.1 hypothetical protein [Bacteroidota bacterium]